MTLLSQCNEFNEITLLNIYCMIAVDDWIKFFLWLTFKTNAPRSLRYIRVCLMKLSRDCKPCFTTRLKLRRWNEMKLAKKEEIRDTIKNAGARARDFSLQVFVTVIWNYSGNQNIAVVKYLLRTVWARQAGGGMQEQERAARHRGRAVHQIVLVRPSYKSKREIRRSTAGRFIAALPLIRREALATRSHINCRVRG